MELTGVQTLKINADVKRQYEAYPYPDYSLFIPLRAQEAYASHSLFTAQLLKEKGISPEIRQNKAARVLIAGSGDVLPYVLSFWEPSAHRLSSIDLSQKNIDRARLRSSFRPQTMDWIVGNLEDKSFAIPEGNSHIDSYGVLHHLSDPKEALKRLSQVLVPGGTMRIMVYNSSARHWIHSLQEAFRALGLDPFLRSDLDIALGLLKRLMAKSPSYRDRLKPMEASIFHHTARFVDTFFHAHEGRVSLSEWLGYIHDAGLEILGLYDRYAELDDLPNPLLQLPESKALEERISDRRFENNLELYLTKRGEPKAPENVQTLPSQWRRKMPPKAWFSYSETNRISLRLQMKIWWAHLRLMEGKKGSSLDSIAKVLEPNAIKRLARIGAIFPSQFVDKELGKSLLSPLHSSMDKPEPMEVTNLNEDKDLKDELLRILKLKQKSPESLASILRLLSEAQKA